MLIGVAIAVGAAVAFLLIGMLCAWGGWLTSRHEIVRGFTASPPTAPERALTWLGLWGPLIIVALFCVLAGMQILAVVARAIVQ